MPSFLEPEFEPNYKTWVKEPTPVNTSALLKTMSPIVESAIKTYAPGADSPTLRSKARMIMAGGLKNYDPNRAKLRTHMMVQLQGLRRASAQENQIVRLPEQVAIDAGRLNNASNFLKDKLGRDPSDSELADHTSLSVKRIAHIRQAKLPIAEGSISSVQGDEGESSFSPEIETPDSYLQWQEFVYHDLDPVDQLIFEHTLGAHGKKLLSNQDLARKLRLSPGAISQRKAKIQGKLDMRDELNVI
jgi:DNA-directed RNA polymerase specialized sigma subunit